MSAHNHHGPGDSCSECGAPYESIGPCVTPKPLWLVGSKLLDRVMSVVEGETMDEAVSAYATEIGPWLGGIEPAQVRERYTFEQIRENEPASYTHKQLSAAITVAGLFTKIGRRLRAMWRLHPEYSKRSLP